MEATEAEVHYAYGLIDDSTLFEALFSPESLKIIFSTRFANTTGKGVDRLNGFQFAIRSSNELEKASEKCLSRCYRFAPYLENLKIKGRDKPPRLISIPTVRDRVVLHQLNKFLACLYPERVPKNIANAYIRQITEDLRTKSIPETWVCGTDIRTFYDSIKRDRLISVLAKKIKCKEALALVQHAISTPTVAKNTHRKLRAEFRSIDGVPQGLAISNILASIYMQGIDDVMPKLGVTYYRYVDDVLMYGEKLAVERAFRSLKARLNQRGLRLHPLGSGKSSITHLSKTFRYLGYSFNWPEVTVRESTIERFLHSIAAKFSDYIHNKKRRLERYKYLNDERLAEIFLMELNERITGAISESKRYGWIAYFNQITDLSLLHRLDAAIAGMFSRLPEFDHKPPSGLKKLRRAYFAMRYSPEGGYVRNYDKITTRAEKLHFLEERGRIAHGETLTDDQIYDRFERYRRRVLSEMHADEGAIYG